MGEKLCRNSFKPIILVRCVSMAGVSPLQYCAFFSDCFSVLCKGRQTFIRDPSRASCTQISHDSESCRVSFRHKIGQMG